jgi:N-hydroxyarylamine O-acetyltransferase
LHRAHLAAIPFENLDVVLGPRVSVELDRIQDKLVRGRRGGYCYERNLLFAAVLQRLGYPVQRLLARVGDDPVRPRPRTQGR